MRALLVNGELGKIVGEVDSVTIAEVSSGATEEKGVEAMSAGQVAARSDLPERVLRNVETAEIDLGALVGAALRSKIAVGAGL
jgi:hypothetical protein